MSSVRCVAGSPLLVSHTLAQTSLIEAVFSIIFLASALSSCSSNTRCSLSLQVPPFLPGLPMWALQSSPGLKKDGWLHLSLGCSPLCPRSCRGSAAGPPWLEFPISHCWGGDLYDLVHHTQFLSPLPLRLLWLVGALVAGRGAGASHSADLWPCWPH